MARRVPSVIEFERESPAPLIEAIVRSSDGRGWVNISPGDLGVLLETVPRPGPFTALFGGQVKPFAVGTIMVGDPSVLGILHPFGRLGRTGLADRGVILPAGFVQRQDHARRGLLIHCPSSTPAEELARCTLELMDALNGVEFASTWTAELYLR